MSVQPRSLRVRAAQGLISAIQGTVSMASAATNSAVERVWPATELRPVSRRGNVRRFWTVRTRVSAPLSQLRVVGLMAPVTARAHVPIMIQGPSVALRRVPAGTFTIHEPVMGQEAA